MPSSKILGSPSSSPLRHTSLPSVAAAMADNAKLKQALKAIDDIPVEDLPQELQPPLSVDLGNGVGGEGGGGVASTQEPGFGSAADSFTSNLGVTGAT